MFRLIPLKKGRPMSFIDPIEFESEQDAIREARKLNQYRNDNPESDDGVRYNVEMDKPAGDTAVIWDHKIGPTYIG